eukprot:NODE_236_length_11993_cov_1.471078.p2 type:complete len:825 gc:universal NODE_236_length_11993_cov_1.471078:7666-10140(+)
MTRTKRILDHCWAHSSNEYLVSSFTALNHPEMFTSDHFPCLIELGVNNPVLNAEKINWSKLSLPEYRNKYKSLLQSTIKQFETTFETSNNVNKIDKLLTNCILTTGKTILGTIPSNPDSIHYGKSIETLSKNIKRLQRKYGRSSSNKNRSKLLKKIKKKRKVFNKMVEQQVYQTRIDKINEFNTNSTLAYHEMCKIKNITSKSNDFCKLEDMIQYQKQHFGGDTVNWPKKEQSINSEEIVKMANEIFTRTIIKRELRYLNCKKASGGIIPTIAYKFLPSNGIKIIKRLLCLCYSSGDIPESFKFSTLVEIYKNKGNKDNPVFYRPVSLLVILRKIYEKIMYYNKLQQLLIPTYRQHGFCSSRGTLTQLHYVNNLIKNYGQNGDVFMASLDLSSAFDNIDWQDIQDVFQNKLDSQDFNVIRSLINKQCIQLKRDNNRNIIEMRKGVPQGGTLSPLIFSYLLDHIVSSLEIDHSKLSLCLYADDIFTISNDLEYLETTLNRITNKLEEHSFCANVNKYQFCGPPDLAITVQNTTIQSIPYIKYLGVHLDLKGIHYEVETAHKKRKLEMILSEINSTKQQLFHAKPLFIKGVLDPILSYGLALWSPEKIFELEKLRITFTTSLFGHSRKIHEYLCEFNNCNELYHKSRIQLESQIKNIIEQLRNINTPVWYINTLKANTEQANTEQANSIFQYCPLFFNTSKDVDDSKRIRLEHEWNNNLAKRGSQLNTNSNLIKLLKKQKFTYIYSHHILRLGVRFMMGDLPFRIDAGCELCWQPYEDGLQHFELDCTDYRRVDYLETRIYNTFKNGTENEIFDILKKLKSVTTPK